jgi:hypothetical protein
MAFRQSEMTGVVCDPSPGGQVISFDESRSGGEQGQDVTGCALALGDPDAELEQLAADPPAPQRGLLAAIWRMRLAVRGGGRP